MYRGLNQSALDIINPESRSYTRLALPTGYDLQHSHVRSVSISSDTRYISVASKVGFAHLSTTSGRWRTLESFNGITPPLEDNLENVPQVRGGMCWYRNILLVGAEFAEKHEVRFEHGDVLNKVRLYHRNAAGMHLTSWVHREPFDSPILLMSVIGDSLLVYCQDNTLYHFLIVPSTENGGYESPPRLVQFGQISFRGIIHSPTRVRTISWILPDVHTSKLMICFLY
jgi:hypothetical protein